MNTMQSAMTMLFKHGKASMSTAELREISALTEHASNEADYLSDMCEGLACTIVSDAQAGPGAGWFEDTDGACALLRAMSHSFGTIAAMVKVGDAAESELEKRREQAASLPKAEGGAA